MADWIDYGTEAPEGRSASVRRRLPFALLGGLVAFTLALGMRHKATYFFDSSVCGLGASLWYDPWWDVEGPPLYGGWVVGLAENGASVPLPQDRLWLMRCGIGPFGLVASRGGSALVGYSYSVEAELSCMSILILSCICAAEMCVVRQLMRRGARLRGDCYLAIALFACGLGTLLPTDGRCTSIGAALWTASTVFGLSGVGRDRCKLRVALGVVLVLDAIFVAGAFG